MVRELNAKEKDLLHRVEAKVELQPFFFRKLKGLHWFDPLFERGFLSPDKNPKPIPAKEEGYVNIPSWPVTEYLVATSEELSLPENEEYAYKFLELIRQTTSYAQANEFSNYWTWWQMAKVIQNIPFHFISQEDLALVDYWLDDPYERGLVAEEIGKKWLPELLEKTDRHCTQMALGLLGQLYTIKFVDKKAGSYERKKIALRYDSWHAKKITKKIAVLSGQRLGADAVKVFESKLISVLEELDNDSWSSIWRNAVEEHEQNRGGEDAEDILISAYRDCLLGFVDKDVKSAIDYLSKVFDEHYQTLKRVAVYAINQRFAHLKSLVDAVLLPDHFSDNFRHELWHFLNQHYRQISPQQQRKTIEIIESLELADEAGKLKDGPTAYKRSIWLSAIKEHDQQASQLYKKYTEITQTEPDHPDFSSYTSVGWGGHESPIPLDDLLSLKIDELVKTVNSYEDPGRFREPGIEGLVKAFKDVVKAKADEFYLMMDKFIDSDLAYIHSIIVAYQELWSEKKQLPWNAVWSSVLGFCEKLVGKEDFWSEENAKQRESFIANRHWIVSSIGRLIEDGTKSDDHAFAPELLPKAKEILIVLIERQEGEEFKEDSDAVFVAINSPRGCCIEALINHSLRACRLADKASEDHTTAWHEYQAIYNSELRRSERNEYEFATLVVNCLPNFLYMSKEWVCSNLSNIFDQSDYQKWLCAMQGYAYVSSVYQEVYKHMKSNGDFIKALDDHNLRDLVQEKVMQNIVISYVYGHEDLDDQDSLISILLDRKDYNELRQLIWFIRTLRGKDKVDLAAKVYELWPRLLEVIDFENKEGRKLASSLCLWAAFVKQVDATSEKWLLKIAPYAEEDHNSYKLVKSLARISEKQALQAQKIWLKMLDSYSYDYPEEAIRQILANLVALGAEGERKAKEVIDAYIRHGIDRPRKLLNEIMRSDGQ